MKNGRLKADLSTKMGTKLLKNPIIVFQILYTLRTMENGVGGSAEKYLKLETKLPKPDPEKFTKR